MMKDDWRAVWKSSSMEEKSENNSEDEMVKVWGQLKGELMVGGSDGLWDEKSEGGTAKRSENSRR